MNVSKLKLHFRFSFALVFLFHGVAVAQEIELIPSPVDPVPLVSDGGTVAIFPVAGAMPQLFTFSGTNSTASGNQSMFDLVSHPSVIKDLEIVDEQIKQFHSLQAEAGKQISEQMKGLRNGSISGEEYTQLVLAQKATREKRMNEILLPHQLKRLQQIDFQMRTKGINNFSRDKFDRSIAEKLGLSAEQQNQLRDKSREIDKRMKAEIKRMRAEAKKELLGVLTAAQRAKFAELSGAKYEEKAGDWNEYIKKHTPKKN